MWGPVLSAVPSSSSTTARPVTIQCGSTTFETTVTSQSTDADAWVRGIRACQPCGRPLVVGVDCKWKSTSEAWPQINKAAVLQLCVGTSCLVHQLSSSMWTPSSIGSLLTDPDVRFVGVGDDAAKLAHAVGMACVDLAGVCEDYLGFFFSRTGFKGFARQTLYVNMEKPSNVKMSDWGKRELDADQIKYACIDAYVAYKLGEIVFDDKESNSCIL